MSLKPSEIFARARATAQDADADYWPNDELITFINDGRVDIYKYKPEVYSTIADVTLTAGVQQTLPNASTRLLSVRHNVSHASKRAITPIDEAELARHRPNWRSTAGATEILHYIYSPSDRELYAVFPPAASAVQVSIDYAKPPTPVTDALLDTVLTDEGELATALVDYVLYRAFQKESDSNPTFGQRSAAHYAAFLGALGVKGEG